MALCRLYSLSFHHPPFEPGYIRLECFSGPEVHFNRVHYQYRQVFMKYEEALLYFQLIQKPSHFN